MEVAVLRKLPVLPPVRGDRVVLFADSNGVVWARSTTDGLLRIATTADLAAYSPLAHGHAISDTSGLQAALDGKEAVDAQRIQIGTPVTASGTSVDFTGLPSGVRRIHVSWSGLSTSGTSSFLIQIGDSGGVETTGYVTSGGSVATGPAVSIGNRTDGWADESGSAAGTRHGSIVLTLINASTNLWAGLMMHGRGDTAVLHVSAGSKALSATLDRVRITTGTGVDTFDAGSVNILYER